MVSAASNGAHNLKERVAGWLLLIRARPITQTLLAEMQVSSDRPSRICRDLERAGWIARAGSKSRYLTGPHEKPEITPKDASKGPR
jgi:hypothetical protein